MKISCDVCICVYNDEENQKCLLRSISIMGGSCQEYITTHIPSYILESCKARHQKQLEFSSKNDGYAQSSDDKYTQSSDEEYKRNIDGYTQSCDEE